MPTVERAMEATAPSFAGERLSVPEKVVVAPCLGQFRPASPETVTAEGEVVDAGQVVGYIDVQGRSVPVRSHFAGWMMGLLAHDGERVREGQPIAWLRAL
jgi:acetyl-CoA carboxylase biotin carboxyl carrier protein